MKIINGQGIADKIKDKIVKEIVATCPTGITDITLCDRPNLALLLVGNRPDSEIYVSMKEKEAAKVGIDTHLYRFAENAPESEILNTIMFLNNDDLIDAILVQLPLPDHISTEKIISAIKPNKDVDCFHPQNIESLKGGNEALLPPLYMVVNEMLAEIKFEFSGKKAVVACNSSIFGDGLSDYLNQKGLNARMVRPDDDLAPLKEADLVIVAIGRPNFIKGDMLKKDSVVIDVGINKNNEDIVGDVDIESVKKIASYISPVPGGVGPLTIAAALLNTLKLHQRKISKN